MKKLIAMALSAAMMLSMFTACSSEGKEQGGETLGESKSADIVIIGAGGAGMTAAVQAKMDGATNVVIVEKASVTGGNTTRATGGLNASETKYQAADGIEDSNDLYFEDTMKGGKNLNNPDLVRYMVEKSKDAVDFVNEIGGDLAVVGQFGGASVKRIHRPSDTSSVGPMLVKTLTAKLEEMKVPVLFNTKAEEIVMNDGKVAGVKVTDENGTYIIDCKAVVMSTGGFSANTEMVIEYNPKLEGFGTTNVPGAMGEGIKMGVAVGAATVDLDQIQTHPTVNPDTQTMYTEGVRGNGAILVNKEGNRFINELETRDVVSAAILKQTDKVAYMVFDQEVRDSLKAIEKYVKAGIVMESDTIEGLAELIGADPATLKATMDSYAEMVKSGSADELGRENIEVSLTTPKYYACLCAPAVHHTMGGLKIDTAAQVISTEDAVIPGFFAAGEVTGGVHGGNRLGGNAVTDIVVFGRTAGASANSYVVENGGYTEPTIVVEGAEETETVKPEVEANFKDGTYTAKSKGMADMTVEVVVKDGEIVSIELIECGETEGIYEAALKEVIPAIIKGQTTEVDVAAGATLTSNAIIAAVTDVMNQAA